MQHGIGHTAWTWTYSVDMDSDMDIAIDMVIEKDIIIRLAN